MKRHFALITENARFRFRTEYLVAAITTLAASLMTGLKFAGQHRAWVKNQVAV